MRASADTACALPMACQNATSIGQRVTLGVAGEETSRLATRRPAVRRAAAAPGRAGARTGNARLNKAGPWPMEDANARRVAMNTPTEAVRQGVRDSLPELALIADAPLRERVV